MKRFLLLKMVLLMVLMAGTAGAAVFTVTPASDSDCSDYQCDLQSALTAAASNGQNDTINMAAGTYLFTSTIRYVPTPESGENFSLTIAGSGETTAILDCGSNAQALLIDTTTLPDGSRTVITLNGFKMTGTGDANISTDASIIFNCLFNMGLGLVTFNAGGAVTNNAGGAIVGLNDPVVGPITVPTINLTAEVSISTSGNTSGIILTPGNVTLGSSAINIQTPGVVGVVEGRTVTLDVGGIVALGNIAAGQWIQVSGHPVTLSNPASANINFVAPPVDAGGTTVAFEYRAVNGSGSPVTVSSTISVTDNGITGFPADAVTFRSATDKNMAVRLDSGALTRIATVDPKIVAGSTNIPSNMIYGLVDMDIKTNNPGDTATVTVFLPSPAPEGYRWFKYNDLCGWYDFSNHAVFNVDRTQVTLTLVDGGVGDDDGVADGVIKDPSGLGTGSTPTGETSSGSGGGGVGCFIATTAYGSALDPHVAILRAFRDSFLLTNSAGNAFVRFYYKYSPPIADFIAHHNNVKVMVRVCLLPAIGLSWVALTFGYVPLLAIIFLMYAGFVGYSRLRIGKVKRRS